MRVPTNSISDRLINQLQTLTAKQAKLQNQAATGQRITNPSDDPAAVGRILDTQSEKQRIQQYGTNNTRAQAVTQASFSSLKDLKSISDRAGEISALSDNGATSPDAFRAYAAEVDQMLEQALQVSNSKFSGEYIFGGTKNDTAPFSAARDVSGKITGITYNGSATSADFRVSEGTTLSPYTTGTENQQFADFVNNLVSLRDSLKNSDPAAVNTARTGLQTSEDQLLSAMSNLGAKQTRLETDSKQNDMRFAELEKLTSADADADLSQTLVKLNQTQTSYQAALQSGAKFLELSLMDYIR
jgi:flagellar hook-associated protein 3 FlgL